MRSAVLQTIEKQPPLLSRDEQLWLIEPLARRLRNASRPANFAAEMAAMAVDPEIQAELQRIEAESSGIHEGD